MLNRRKLLTIVGGAALGVAGVGGGIAIHRGSSGHPDAPRQQTKFESVTLTIHGMI